MDEQKYCIVDVDIDLKEYPIDDQRFNSSRVTFYKMIKDSFDLAMSYINIYCKEVYEISDQAFKTCRSINLLSLGNKSKATISLDFSMIFDAIFFLTNKAIVENKETDSIINNFIVSNIISEHLKLNIDKDNYECIVEFRIHKVIRTLIEYSEYMKSNFIAIIKNRSGSNIDLTKPLGAVVVKAIVGKNARAVIADVEGWQHEN